MKVTGIRELRANTGVLFGSGEPLLVTRHGRVSGVYVPLDDAGRLPDDLRRQLAAVLGKYFAKTLSAKGVTEKKLKEDFSAYRRRRR
jgi:hypothetical protein